MKSFEEIYAFSHAADGNGTEDHLLCTATAAELKAFIPHVMALAPGSRVLEIGSYTGRSASVYFQLQAELDLDIHLIDCFNWNARHAAGMFMNLVIDHFSNVPFSLHKMFSERLHSRWTSPIDFLYIDGEHEHPGVDFDFANWPALVRPGGILAAHDSQWVAVKECIEKFIRPSWELLSEAERMTVWRKP